MDGPQNMFKIALCVIHLIDEEAKVKEKRASELAK